MFSVISRHQQSVVCPKLSQEILACRESCLTAFLAFSKAWRRVSALIRTESYPIPSPFSAFRINPLQPFAIIQTLAATVRGARNHVADLNVKKLGRDPRKLETLNLFSLLQKHDGSTLYDPANHASFFAQVNSGLAEVLDSESTLRGMRVQSLFAGMVENLGGARLLKQEDVGDCYYEGADLCPPDFRIVTTSGDVMLVETKNHFSKKALSPFRIRCSDLERLERYSAMVGTPLRIAIYWAAWNLWTLTSPAIFSRSGKYAELEFRRATMQNEMASLGDFLIGTKYPLTLKTHSGNGPTTLNL
jgi:hypothetical protein